MRLWLPALFLFLILCGIPSDTEQLRPRLGDRPAMRAMPVVLDPTDPARRTVGALTFLGGVQLTSPDPAFGGFSSMRVTGDRFTLLADTGNFVEFTMGADWQPRDVRFGDLPAGPGTGTGKGDRDSESMTVDRATGQVWVGFEAANAIWRYDPALTRAEAHDRPREMRDWDANGGPESILRRGDRDFLVISETTPSPSLPGNDALRFLGDPTDPRTPRYRFAYRPPPGGFAPSDMAQLPDGRLLVLNRRISIGRWFESRLVLIDPAAIRPGASIAGVEIASFTIPLTRDNFEALGVEQEGGATILWIASDDNLTPLQRSLLMKFRIDLPPR